MPPVPPIPVNRYLVPPVAPTLPEGFTQVSQPITTGLPHTIALNDDLTLALILPNGLAHAWRDSDPSQVVSESGSELVPAVAAPDEPIGVATLPAPRLLLRRTGTTIGVAPLVAGLHRFLPDAGDPGSGVAIEFAVLGWQLHAGVLRGPGDFGSHIDLAWRIADQGSDFFSELPEIPPFLYRLRDIVVLPQLFPRTILHLHIRGKVTQPTLLRSARIRTRF